MTFIIGRHSTFRLPKQLTSPVRHAWEMVARDQKQVLGAIPVLASDNEGPVDIEVRYAEPEDNCPGFPEAYCFRFRESGRVKTFFIAARNDLGLVYGLLEYSRRFLGVDPFWFWTDKSPERRDAIHIPEEEYDSPEPFVRFRGWFVNDEVCLIGWRRNILLLARYGSRSLRRCCAVEGIW